MSIHRESAHQKKQRKRSFSESKNLKKIPLQRKQEKSSIVANIGRSKQSIGSSDGEGRDGRRVCCVCACLLLHSLCLSASCLTYFHPLRPATLFIQCFSSRSIGTFIRAYHLLHPGVLIQSGLWSRLRHCRVCARCGYVHPYCSLS